MIFQMASAEMNWRIVELYVEIFSNDNRGLFLNSLFGTSNKVEDIIVSANRDNQMVNLDSQHFNHVEQNPPFDPTVIFPDQTICNIDSDPSGSPIVHSSMIYDNTEIEDTQNEDVDVMEEEGNDDDEDFIPIIREGWELREDYWHSTDKHDDSDYDPNEKCSGRRCHIDATSQ
jgi:hypothetical protein